MRGTKVEVHVNGGALREIMRSDAAMNAVMKPAKIICDAADADGHRYYSYKPLFVLHPRTLEVSAHVFIDPTGLSGSITEDRHQVLSRAFWSRQGF